MVGSINNIAGCDGREADKDTRCDPTVVADEEYAAGSVSDGRAEAGASPAQIAIDEVSGHRREIEALYGRELSRTRDKVARWRAKQVKEAFSIGEVWAELTQKLTAREVSAFLDSECQIPQRDVVRYVRMATVLKDLKDVLVQHGVAVSVLLDLAGQNEAVRNEAIRMIKAGRSLQAKDLRGLKRDIGLAQAARDGKLDVSRVRDVRNAAARKARIAANSWLASMEAFTNEVIALAELDRDEYVANTAMGRVASLAENARALLNELAEFAGKDFVTHFAATGMQASERGWKRAISAMRRIAKQDVFLEEHFRRPTTTLLVFDHDLVWDLAWVFGYDENQRPDAAVKRMLEKGQVPLDTSVSSPERARVQDSTPTVLEICAGAGGQALGLEAAGFRHTALVEIDDDAAATLRTNRPEWPVIQGDLRELDLRAYEGIDLLAGGVPCQPYSPAGERRGADDDRDLFPDTLRLVRQLKPKAIMLENVRGLFHMPNHVTRLRILSDFPDLGDLQSDTDHRGS